MSKYSAIINEYKGNLFEFLVGSFIATKFNIYEKYFNRIPPVFLASLKEYQRNLFSLDKELYLNISNWANEVGQSVCSQIDQNIREVIVLGKITSNSNEDNFDEADLVIQGDKLYHYSLKLSKSNAFVNTKSAGIMSIFSKYFTNVDGQSIQQKINTKIDFLFEVFVREIHEAANIEFSLDFKNWISAGLPDQPGKLEEHLRAPLLKYYSDVAKQIFGIFENNVNNTEEFKRILKRLLGHTNEDVTQILVFHKNTEISQIRYIDKLNLDNLKLIAPSEKSAYFYINNDSLSLQIRVKPMMSFFQKALKVNCSVKYLD